ncbi:helix-turn-helix transcriptional regulator [Sphingomonas melonis]|uniref:Putative DNA-binding transcriptional regulator YafY n=1 Tax=Sphingomonas melonis TaxID=152682 RepID=A0A7Y9FK34_9SPHN|nr:YafY family protein [Sphingomonas melonis]NYD88357.1 putative DNA-binding transcriptional regulator YafY [Sphingomonas melonis]
MRRADRLFEIVQILRRARGPLTAGAIAAALETSRRSVYRDIAALIAQRVPIRGEAGIGYVLDPGFDMPPLMLTSDEVEAVVLGAQWVVVHADDGLARAAADVLAKVAAVVPPHLRAAIEDPAVITQPKRHAPDDTNVDVARLRAWSLQGRKLAIRYTDAEGRSSARTVWPFLVGYLDSVRMLIAWCELRSDFRMFRTDRLTAIDFLDTPYPERRATLRRRWLAMMTARQAGDPG